MLALSRFWRLHGQLETPIHPARRGQVSAICPAYFSYYQVKADQVAVVTRFGKFVGTKGPGLNFRIPFVESVVKVEAKRQLKTEFGFRTQAAGVKSEFARDERTAKESEMLTGDLNVVTVEWIVHYMIADPYNYLFKVDNVELTLRALSEATMRTVVGDYSVTEVLTRGREEVLENARVHLSELCKRYETGISIQRIELKDSAPPGPVKPSFNEVNQAEQERDRLENEAWAKYNKEVPKAIGEARQTIQTSEGYAIERVNRASGEVQRFLAIEKEYTLSPKVTRARLYFETMAQVMGQAGKKVLFDKRGSNVLPLLLPVQGGSAKASATIGGAP
ncbi:MAG: FtsH protease activity modulator HflK [Myxococcota bacterium]|nr:FtsH protease activity modulator HflK [Myxococcota bacterium]